MFALENALVGIGTRLDDFRVATRPRALEDGEERIYADATYLSLVTVAELGCWCRAAVTKDGIGQFDIDYRAGRQLLVEVLDASGKH